VYVVLSGFAQVIVDLSSVPIHDIEMNDLKHYDQVRRDSHKHFDRLWKSKPAGRR